MARFDGGTIRSDGGSMLLRKTNRRLNLVPRLAECFLDGHNQLRHDPVFSILAGRAELEQPLAGKSTLNQLELGSDKPDRYKKITLRPEAMDELLVKVFIMKMRIQTRGK